MKTCFFFLLSFLSFEISKCQKPMIDTGAFRKWESVRDVVISNNGNYTACGIINNPLGNRSLIIRSMYSNWEKIIVGAAKMKFSQDEKYGVYLQSQDTLRVLKLGTN